MAPAPLPSLTGALSPSEVLTSPTSPASPTAGAPAAASGTLPAFHALLQHAALSPPPHDAAVRPALPRMQTPAALHGPNAALVEREVERLRERGAKRLKLRRRTVAGVVALCCAAFQAYLLVQHVLAFLSLSPGGVPLSDAPAAAAAPDPLLRTLALLCVCIDALALLAVAALLVYLRFSRKRACSTVLVWIAVIVGLTLTLALSIANLAMLVVFHRQGTSALRDVAQRCLGDWDMDLLWSAAPFSPDAASRPSCAAGGSATLRAFLLAGGARLLAQAALWAAALVCLRRYNAALDVRSVVDPNAEESAEMHRLLQEEALAREKGTPGAYPDMRWSYEQETLRNARYLEEEEDEDAREEKAWRDSYASHKPSPRLQRFAWQEPSYAEPHAHASAPATREAGHAREQSGWAAGLIGRAWDALWAPAPGTEQHDETDKMLPERPLPPVAEQKTLPERPAAWYQRDASDSAAPTHQRTASQERRASAARHMPASPKRSSCDSDERRRSGDELPHMPTLMHLPPQRSALAPPPPQKQHARASSSALEGDDSEDAAFWAPRRVAKQAAPVYVRTLGRLVRKLSSIRSAGSHEAGASTGSAPLGRTPSQRRNGSWAQQGSYGGAGSWGGDIREEEERWEAAEGERRERRDSFPGAWA